MKNLLLALLITLSAFGAESGYSCDIQEDGTCLVYMYDILDENKYNIDDALEKCESFDGSYDYETDTCKIEA